MTFAAARVVSRHELFPLRAPLLTLEQCISPFLDSCDPNDDHNITLTEWGSCLQLDQVTGVRKYVDYNNFYPLALASSLAEEFFLLLLCHVIILIS